MKYVVMLSDRCSNSELDLRKNKKSDRQNNIAFFKVEGNDVLSYEETGFYYGWESVRSNLKKFLNDDMKENRITSGFYGTGITSEKYKAYLKFCTKHGKVFETEELDTSFLSVLEDFNNKQAILFDEVYELEKSLPEVETRKKNGQLRRINYKSIIIKSSGNHGARNIRISDEQTNISHVIIQDSYKDDHKLKEHRDTYYGFHQFGDVISVHKGGKKGTKKYIELYQQISDNNKERGRLVTNYVLSLFD